MRIALAGSIELYDTIKELIKKYPPLAGPICAAPKFIITSWHGGLLGGLRRGSVS
jgi:hypothetical protein